MKRIGLHTFVIHNSNAMISTVQISESEFETMVMYDDGDEIESAITHTLEAAKHKHNELMNKYNDMLYNDSIAKYIGVVNYGQFVKTVVSC